MGADFVAGGFYACSDCHALRHELATYRAIVTSAAEERRDLEARLADAQLASDRLTRELANARDKRIVTQAGSTLAHLNAVLRTLVKETGGLEDERIRNAARAHLVECGIVAPEVDAMRQAYGEWEGRR